MSDRNPESNEAAGTRPTTRGKGKAFFDRADQVTETGNWDYAIEMYLEGISKEPDAMERGHQKLREVALMRKAAGGKGPGFFEKAKHKIGKDPLQNLISAEWLMSRDPANPSHWSEIVKAGKALELEEVVRWAGGVLYDIARNTDKNKAKLDIYEFLMSNYAEMKLYPEAVRACQAAVNLNPNSADLTDRLRNLSAQETIQTGKYDQEGDFTKAVKDIKGQMDLAKKDQVSQDKGFLGEQADRARAAYEAEPTVPGKISALVDALLKLDDESYENEAIDVLEKAYRDTGTYRFKMRIGDIKMRQLTRRYNKLRKAGDKEAAVQAAKEQLAFELEEFAERAANYPTDMAIKYELGRRQFIAGRYDDAIATLQQARRDPKHRTSAMTLLGSAFFKKEWYSEAGETFEQALEGDVPEARQKELRYNLGLTFEAQNNVERALQEYSDVAQIDFNYKDVRERIERLRKAREEG